MKTKEERFKHDWFPSQMCRVGQEAHHGQFLALTAAEVISFLMVCLNSSEVCSLNAAVVTLARLSWETRNQNVLLVPECVITWPGKPEAMHVCFSSTTYKAAGHRCSAYTYSHIHLPIYEVCMCVPIHIWKGQGDLQMRLTNTHRWGYL